MGTGQRYKLVACRRAADLTYQVFRLIPRYFQVGIRERQLAWRVGELLRSIGSQQRAFPVIVAFGDAAAQPHHVPTSRMLQYGEIIKIDAGAVYQQMRGDVTRTWWFGKPTTTFLQRYTHVYTAQQLAFKKMRSGVSGQTVDAIARQYLQQHHLGKLFIHSLGHGVGRAIHQPPFLTPRAKGKRLLTTGEVVTNEPGVYQLGWGGIRIEDMVEITEQGPRWLGDAPRQLKQIIVS